MLYGTNRLYRCKIIGGSLFGDLVNKAKGILTSTAKTTLSSVDTQAKNVLKLGT